MKRETRHPCVIDRGTPCETESSATKETEIDLLLSCVTMIFSDHINLPILKEALRIAQTAILVCGACITQVNIIIKH